MNQLIVKMRMDSLMEELSARLGCPVTLYMLALAMGDAYIVKAMREKRSTKQMANHLERYVRVLDPHTLS